LGVAGHAGLLCAFSCRSYGSGLAVAGRMEHGMNSAWMGIGLGRVMGLQAAGLAEVFCAAQLKEGWRRRGGRVLFAGQELDCGPATARRQRRRRTGGCAAHPRY
jgi:hypothetical protein